MNSIFHRRSIRQFEDKLVTDDQITEVLKAAMAAPSAVNAQPWEFYVVRDEEVQARLSEVSPFAFAAKNAPVLIVPCYHVDCTAPEYAQIDMAICCENLMLEADSLGLGTVLLGVAPEEERMKKVQEILSLPQGVECFGLIPMGYPKMKLPEKDTFDEARIHYVD